MTKAKRILLSGTAVIFWLVIWEIFARILDSSFVIPTVGETFLTLISLLATSEFYFTILFSFLRIVLGLVIGISLGILLAFLTHYVKAADILLRPLLVVIKSTPVACFIMILWLIIGSGKTPMVIAILMVMPVVWQNLKDGFDSIDKSLVEVLDIYNVSFKKRLRILIFPTLKKYLIPSIITSAALAWKSGIAAEIISYTEKSIGREIYIAKSYFESGKMFAWTIIVVILSLVIELLLSKLSKKARTKHG